MAAQAVGLAAAVDYLDSPRHGARAPRTSTRSRGRLLAGLAAAAVGARRRTGRHPRPRRRRLVRRRRRPRPRRRADARRRRRRRPGRPPLRLAAAPRASGSTATTRASFAAYNTPDEVDALLGALDRVPAIFGVEVPLMDLYQEIILDHSKRPHHAGLREPFDAEVHHINPTCGDEVTLRVQVDGTGPATPSSPTSRTTPSAARSRRPRPRCSPTRSSAHTVAGRAGDLRRDARHADQQGRGPGRRGRHRRRRRLRRRLAATRPGSSARCWAGRPSRTRWHPTPGPTSTDAGMTDSTEHRTSPTHAEPPAHAGAADVAPRPPPPNVADVEEALRDVVDPELGINVVDLGLSTASPSTRTSHAVIDMTLTSRGLPADRRHRGPDRAGARGPRRPRTGSTGSGCRRGARTRSPTTAASSCARSASTSEPAVRRRHDTCGRCRLPRGPAPAADVVRTLFDRGLTRTKTGWYLLRTA